MFGWDVSRAVEGRVKMDRKELVFDKKRYIREYNRRRYNTDPEFRRKMIESVEKYNKKRYNTDPEFRKRRLGYRKKWALKHKKELKAYDKEYRAKHKKELKERMKEYNKKHYAKHKKAQIVV